MSERCAPFGYERFITSRKETINNRVAGSIRVVRGEGMPHYRNPFEKGDLFIKFEVQFPENKWISPEKLSVSGMCPALVSEQAEYAELGVQSK